MIAYVKQNVLFFWNLFDPLYFRCTKLEYIKDEDGKRTIFRVRLTKYKGRAITLTDGTVIQKNDWLVKIHLHNIKLLRQLNTYDNEIRKALIMHKKVRDALPYLANYIEISAYSKRVKGLIGITSLHKSSHKLGFEVYSIQNPFYKGFKKLAFFPIQFLSTSSMSTSVPDPKYLLMSKDVLYEKYHSVSNV